MAELPASREAVALELWRHLRDADATPDQQLDFYTRCLWATHPSAASKPSR